MNRKPLVETIKELTAKIIRTNMYDPERMDRLVTAHKIEAIITEIDKLAISIENRLLALEANADKKTKGKKHVPEN